MNKGRITDLSPTPALRAISVLWGSRVRHAALRAINRSVHIAIVVRSVAIDTFPEDTSNRSNRRVPQNE